MKIWVDDIRTPPDDSWTWYKTSASLLDDFKIWRNQWDRPKPEAMSLDHDLGGDDTSRPIVLWMCENNFWPVEVKVHSANGPGVDWLEGMIKRYHPDNRHKHPGRGLAEEGNYQHGVESINQIREDVRKRYGLS